MVASQNGWRANDRSVVSSRTVPGTGVKLAVRNGPAGDLLLEVAARFHREVERIDGTADDWGYAERPIRGSTTTLSNHASGTAVDLNATRHALGAVGTFTPEQTAAIHRLVGATRVGRVQVVRWGGDYSGRRDEMHFELMDGTDEAMAATALAQLRGASQQTTARPAADLGTLRRGATDATSGGRVSALQRVLSAWYPDLRLAVDGQYGPATEDAVRRVQQNSPGLTVDGIAGPLTLAALHMA